MACCSAVWRALVATCSAVERIKADTVLLGGGHAVWGLVLLCGCSTVW